MKVYVVVKMLQGEVKAVDVFTSRPRAYTELKNWIESRRSACGTVHITEITGDSYLLPLTPDETEHLIHALEYYDNDLRDNPDFFDSWTPEEIEEAQKIISGILRKATNEDDQGA